MESFLLRTYPTQLKFNNPLPSKFTEILHLPSLKMLLELIALPEHNPNDLTHLSNYQLRPQEYNAESENYLMERNNIIVSWLAEKHGVSSDFAVAEKEWCQRYKVNYGLVVYYRNVIDYCRLLLPGVNMKQDGISKISNALKTSKHSDWIDLANSSGQPEYVQRLYNRELMLIYRFNEYKLASDCLSWIQRQHNYLDEMSAAIDTENKRVGTVNRNNQNKRYSGVFDSSILTQCIMCYRFHKQTPTSKNSLAKHCPGCKTRFGNWTGYLRRNTEIRLKDLIFYGV
jgi:hypothetical protein